MGNNGIASMLHYLLVDTFLIFPTHNICFRVATDQYDLSQVVAAYMMIKALNNKGYSAFAISVPSPKEFMQIFAIAAPVFVTMFSKVCYVLFSSNSVSAPLRRILCICVFVMFRWLSIPSWHILLQLWEQTRSQLIRLVPLRVLLTVTFILFVLPSIMNWRLLPNHSRSWFKCMACV